MKIKHKINILQNKANSEIAPEKWNKISETLCCLQGLYGLFLLIFATLYRPLKSDISPFENR
ncbi:MAG: hypothetical protein DGJ47_000815 [Rickettsiaceae bacterium]